jgi:hypothetical protein
MRLEVVVSTASVVKDERGQAALLESILDHPNEVVTIST